MDVSQRLDEIRQMAIGLRELGLAPESHGHLLAALYFCEGVTELPAVIGVWQEDVMQEIQDGRQHLRDALENIQREIGHLRESIGYGLDHELKALEALTGASKIQSVALRRLVTERGGTDETIPDRQEEAEHTNGWEDENTVSRGTDSSVDRQSMLDAHNVDSADA